MAPSLSLLFDITHKISERYLFIIMLIIIVTLIVDTSIIKLSDLSFKSSSFQVIGVFTMISAISLIGQNVILNFVRMKAGSESAVAKKNIHLYWSEKGARIVHYTLAAIIAFVVLQMFVISSYSVVMLTAAVTISYAFAIAMMVFLGQRFLSWFRVNRSHLVLLYGLSSVMLAVNAGVSLSLVDSILLDKPFDVMPQAVSLQAPPIYPGTAIDVLNSAYIITTVTSFIVTWSATVVLLSHYAQKIGKFRYRILLSLPLAYFISQFLSVSLNLLGPLIMSDPIFFGMLFTLVFTLSKPIGGIIFGVAFWTVAKKISKDNMLRSYVIICACGFMLLFTSDQAIVLAFAPYPPFGLVTISFVGLSSYLVLVGIQSSALSISQDTKLRQEVRKIAIKESNLLGFIGEAQIENEIRLKVLGTMKAEKNRMTEATAIPPTLSEDEIKQYLEDVLGEIKSKKEKKDTVA